MKMMEVYHSTNSKFETFENPFMGMNDEGYFGRGFYFVEDWQDAKSLQSQAKYRYFMTCEVSENLYELDLEDGDSAINSFPASDEIKAKMREIAEYEGNCFFKSGAGEGFGLEKFLKEAGFDGAIVRHRFANSGYTEIVVFDAKDIKITEIEDEKSED